MNDLLVPITKFHQGKAHSVFMDVAENGVMVVTKNQKPVCVLISPSRFETFLEMLEDYELCFIASERLEKLNPEELVSQEEIMKEYGITKEDLDNFDVDIS